MSAGGGARLTRWVQSLGIPYGREPSVKLVEGRVLADRFLLTFSRADLGPSPAEALLVEARRWNIPESLEESLVLACEDSDIVHLGWEGGSPGDARGGMIKIYFELVRTIRTALERWEPGDSPLVVHRAIKWDERGESGTTARYSFDPGHDASSIAARIEELLPAGAAELALELLERAVDRAGLEALLFMEVEEPENPRRSFDLNVYRAGIPLADLDGWISRIWTHFGLDGASRPLQVGSSPDFGHLAGGTDREGREFFSLYHGIERGA